MNSEKQDVRSHQSAMKPALLIAMALATMVMLAGVSSAAEIGVKCALPYLTGNAQSCVGQHRVTVLPINTTANAKINIEAMGLDANGFLINTFTVANGAALQFGSRTDPADWKFVKNNNYDAILFAPVPLLRVTVEDQNQKAVAYCSPIPYIQMIQPTGGVVTESGGNNTNVLAAVPLTDPTKLHLFVDGVDILPQVNGGNYLACTPTSPCSGNLNINGNPVSYSNLQIDIASAINQLASNTVKVTLSALTCGGHIFNVTSSPTAGYANNKKNLSGQCNVDSLTKNATSSVFAIKITNPLPGQVQPLIPTPVVGEVCSGQPVLEVSVNGKDPYGGSGPPNNKTAGNGITTGDVYKNPINMMLGRTDLAKDALGGQPQPLGTFDIGSNRLAAAAKDNLSNRTFKNVIFATGSVAPVAIDPNATIFQTASVNDAISSQLGKLVEDNLTTSFNGPSNTELANAFIVGLSAGGTQTMFNKLCTSPVQSTDLSINGLTPGQIFKKKVEAALLATPVTSKSISSPCSCDPTVYMWIDTASVGTNVSCKITFQDTKFHVQMKLPDVHVTAKADGWCKTVDDVFGLCVEGLAIALQGSADVTGITFDFDVTESNLLHDTVDQAPVFYKGDLKVNANTNLTNGFGDQGISFCGLSVLCDVLVTIFTFGAVDITPSIDITKIQDFSGQIGASQPDPVKLKGIKVDESQVQNFDQKLSGTLSEVHINPSGLTAGLIGKFASLAVDPTVPTPNVTLTPAPVPAFPIPNVQDIFVGLSDDSINMMFATLTGAGKLKTGPANGNGCIDTNTTVGSLLPADCDTLAAPDGLGSNLATVAARAYCHAIKGDNCGTLAFSGVWAGPRCNSHARHYAALASQRRASRRDKRAPA
jgi:hypothetical protein